MLLYRGLVIICLVCFIGPKLSQAKYEAECTTPMNKPGKCMPIKSCAFANTLYEDIQASNETFLRQGTSYLQQLQCDYQRGVPYVCCPAKEIRMNPDVFNHLSNLECGIDHNFKIANGQIAFMLDYRWTALLLYQGVDEPVCDGAVIDERHVLTAAHCLQNFKILPYAVRLGEFNRSTERDCIQLRRKEICLDPTEDIEIEEIFPHDDYVFKGIRHDVALLRLKRPIKFGKNISPICLPITKELQNAKFDDYIVAGWGQTHNHRRVSDVLLYVHLPKHPIEYCSNKLPLNVTEENICAGGQNFEDSCQGDSGGALFGPSLYMDGVARQIQYGIVSVGINSCGQSTFPAVYTSVPHYLQWITDHMQIEDNNPST